MIDLIQISLSDNAWLDDEIAAVESIIRGTCDPNVAACRIVERMLRHGGDEFKKGLRSGGKIALDAIDEAAKLIGAK